MVSPEDTIRNLNASSDQGASFNGAHEDDDWRLFSPRFDDDGAAYERLRQLAKLPSGESVAQLDVHARAHASYAPQALRIRVAAILLRDLLRIGWDKYVDSHWIYVRPPKAVDCAKRKENIRQQLLFGRNDQLTQESNRSFLFALERPSKYASTKPVTDLIADGRRLAKQLEDAVAAPVDRRVEFLRHICRPYLQLVTDERDQFTNIRLSDVWRYFRHSWVTRYRSSPGPNLYYLVRDSAQPNHPVMGIAALGNTVMQLTTRDRALGWTIEGLIDLINRGIVSDGEILAAFRHRLEEDYNQIFLDDLPVDRRIECSVHDEALSRLSVIEEDAQKAREGTLTGNDETATKRPQDFSPERLLELTKTPLFRTKRARVAREVLKAYRTLVSWEGSIHALAKAEDGAWALGLVIKQLKKQFSATSMMEITVCGAVPPYNHLLGGKLVCLLMISPQVVRHYRERYSDVISVIASQMAGRPITKKPHLAFLAVVVKEDVALPRQLCL
ncbi:MAG: Druantia anti-phage system protein DruA [Gammaproteobacteria bacterium]